MISFQEMFRKYWGLTGTAEEFWNMIPFSWLLDYFFQIGKALRYTDVDKNLDLQSLDYAESHLVYAGKVSGIRRTSDPCSSIIDGKLQPVDSWMPVQGYYSSDYNRVITQPMKVGLIVPKFKVPSTGQWLNVAALVRTMV
jgi:hypothetical protein